MRLRGLAILLALVVSSPASAADPDASARAVDRAIGQVIVPGYAALADAATYQATAMARLCDDDAALDEARAAFAPLVVAFARVEPYRFGPARTDNRFERLSFWPDRRGRGLRQVQGLIAKEDETALDRTTLQGKSVAVQGLLALDFVLFGTGSDEATAYRCRYGHAVARAIQGTAAAIRDDWAGDHGALMRAAGPDNPLYRSSGEAVQVLLQAAGEQLQIVRDLKLGAVVRDAPEAAKPKAAPFWRSNLALAAVVANIDGVAALFDKDVLGGLAPGLADELAFELKQARRAIAEQADGDLAATLADPAAHGRLTYAAIPLTSAMAIVSERMPQALGVTIGFNSLDGD